MYEQGVLELEKGCPFLVSEVRLTKLTAADKRISLISPPHLHLNSFNIKKISLGRLIAS